VTDIPDERIAASDGRIGLIAGGGTFPHAVARAARKRGFDVICAGIRHEVFPDLASEVDAFRVLGLGRWGAVVRYFHRHEVRVISWAGWIRKERFFTPWRTLSLVPDWRALKFILRQLADRQNQTLLKAIADEFEREGFDIAHSAQYCPELLVERGLLTKRRPSKKQLQDIAFGWRVAKRIADLDVGQSVAVVDRATIAVEGMEGTDRNILRAGELCRRGFTVVKLAKDGHDMRFDVPAVGPQTIETLKQARGAVLALEAGKTLVLERQKLIETADRYGIVVVAFEGPPDAEAPFSTNC